MVGGATAKEKLSEKEDKKTAVFGTLAANYHYRSKPLAVGDIYYCRQTEDHDFQ